MNTGPLWLCISKGHHCYQNATTAARARVRAEEDCGCNPITVRFAGYSQGAAGGGTSRPKGHARRMRRRLELRELSGRVRHVLEVYAEARNGGSTRNAAAIRNLMADVGSVLERVDMTADDRAYHLAKAIDGDDAEGLRAALCTALILIDCGWSADDALAFANRARRIEARVGG